MLIVLFGLLAFLLGVMIIEKGKSIATIFFIMAVLTDIACIATRMNFGLLCDLFLVFGAFFAGRESVEEDSL